MPESREVIRCSCGLNQFLTRDGLCRKPDCRKPLRIVVATGYMAGTLVPDLNPAFNSIPGGYKPEHVERVEPIHPPARMVHILPSFVTESYQAKIADPWKMENVSTVVSDIVSNVRRRGKVLTKINKQPRYRNEGLSIRDFPTELRLACLQYAEAHGMTLREVAIAAIKKMIDTEE